MIVALYYNEEHKPLGYLVYYIANEIFHIKEMVYLTSEARHGLWNYISAHFSMITQVRGDNYSGEPMAYLFEDSEIEETIAPYIMARIVDVENFLQEYPWQIQPEDFKSISGLLTALLPGIREIFSFPGTRGKQPVSVSRTISPLTS